MSTRPQELNADFENIKLKLRELFNLCKVLNLQVAAVEKKAESLALSPENVFTVAHEVDEKQLRIYFTMYPWAKYIQLTDKTLVSREEHLKKK